MLVLSVGVNAIVLDVLNLEIMWCMDTAVLCLWEMADMPCIYRQLKFCMQLNAWMIMLIMMDNLHLHGAEVLSWHYLVESVKMSQFRLSI